MKTLLFPGLLLALTALAGPGAAQAQGRYLTKVGHVTFLSPSIIEDIEAKNQQAAAVIDLGAGQLAFSIPIKGFVFKRTLMQEHFNENYLESDKFPKATFSGKFPSLNNITPGSHTVQVEGDLFIHGVTHHVSTPAAIELKDGQLLAAATFTVAPADYAIEIPMLVRDHIAKIVTVQVKLVCMPVAAPPATAAPNAATRSN